MKPRTIIGIVLIVAGAWKLANIWGIIENDWLWRQPWTTYIAPAARLSTVIAATQTSGSSVLCLLVKTASASVAAYITVVTSTSIVASLSKVHVSTLFVAVSVWICEMPLLQRMRR